MELITYDIPMRNGKPITIIPIGDIQWAGERGSTSLRLLQETIARGLKENAYFIGMGDYIDFLSPSNRQRLSGAALYDTATDIIDDKAMALVYELYEKALKPTKGRFLGCLEGHHYSQLKCGSTTDQKLCELLDTTFLGTSAYIRLVFHNGNISKRGGFPITIWCTHGHGGGSKSHAPILKLENAAAYWEADIMLVGHMSKMPATPINRIYPIFPSSGKPHLLEKTIYLAGTGGFSKGYVEGSKQGITARGSYVEQKMLNPVALGAPTIRITPYRANKIINGKRLQPWEPTIRIEV